jgi:hypothetical protein
LESHGFEYVVTKNDGRGEAATFSLMLDRVASTNDDELTFYAHAKGVRYEPQFPLNVRRWAEVQYCVTLDDWLAVKDQLQHYAMTGIFRKHGRFANHRNLGDWHYSGTFFWMRHSHVFRRRYLDVPQFYCGVEAWPGMHFARHETGCLMMDGLRELPYSNRFWASKGNPAFSQWMKAVRHVQAPADLATPAPFEGHQWPRLEQKPEEFGWWIEQLLDQGVTSLLNIGSMCGGAEWHVARAFHQHERRISITAVEMCERPELVQAFEDARQKFGQSMTLVVGDSGSVPVRRQLAEHYDAVFIDADHSYRACRGDFELAKSLTPGLVGLHDIVDSDWHASVRCCVSRVWDEIAKEHRTQRMASGDWAGIGIVRLDRPGH